MRTIVQLFAVLASVVTACAQTPAVKWDVETGRQRPVPFDITLRRGESVLLQPRFLSYSVPMVIATNAAIEWRQANGTGYITNSVASVVMADTGRVSVSWGPWVEGSNSTAAYEISVSGTMLRAYGTLTLLGGVGDPGGGVWPTQQMSASAYALLNPRLAALETGAPYVPSNRVGQGLAWVGGYLVTTGASVSSVAFAAITGDPTDNAALVSWGTGLGGGGTTDAVARAANLATSNSLASLRGAALTNAAAFDPIGAAVAASNAAIARTVAATSALWSATTAAIGAATVGVLRVESDTLATVAARGSSYTGGVVVGNVSVLCTTNTDTNTLVVTDAGGAWSVVLGDYAWTGYNYTKDIQTDISPDTFSLVYNGDQHVYNGASIPGTWVGDTGTYAWATGSVYVDYAHPVTTNLVTTNGSLRGSMLQVSSVSSNAMETATDAAYRNVPLTGAAIAAAGGLTNVSAAAVAAAGALTNRGVTINGTALSNGASITVTAAAGAAPIIGIGPWEFVGNTPAGWIVGGATYWNGTNYEVYVGTGMWTIDPASPTSFTYKGASGPISQGFPVYWQDSTYKYMAGGYSGGAGLYRQSLGATSTWTAVAAMPASGISYAETLKIGNNWWIFGGYPGPTASNIWTTTGGSPTNWTRATGAAMGQALSELSVMRWGPYLYRFGGALNGSTGQSTIYSASTNTPQTWADTGLALAAARRGTKVFTLGGRIWLTGNGSTQGAVFPTAWASVGPTLTQYSFATMLVLTNGTAADGVYVYGSEGGASTNIYRARIVREGDTL